MVDVFKSAFTKLKKKFSKGSEYYLTIYLVINVIWIFLGIVLFNYFKISYRGYSISLILFMVINFILIVFFNFLKKIKFDKIDVFLILLVIFGIISTIFSKDISISLYGYWKRYEGFCQLLYYYSLMYLATNVLNEKNKKKVIYFILGFGLINVVRCFFQVYHIYSFLNFDFYGSIYGLGFMLNTNFFGSYMTLCLCLSLGIFLYSKKTNNVEYVVNFLLCLCFFSGLLMSNALSGMVGLFIVCIFIIIYFIYLCVKKIELKNNIFKHVILLISCLVVFFCLSYTNATVMGGDVIRMAHETSEMTKGNMDDGYGSFRMFLWKKTLNVVPKHLLHGVGVDCFFDAFDTPLVIQFSPNHIEYYDKAHNEYLQKLVCEGIFSCVSYIGMLFFIFINSIKRIIKEKNYIVMALFLAFVGYSVQAFFNISVIEVAPLFWIIIGLLYDRKCKEI